MITDTHMVEAQRLMPGDTVVCRGEGKQILQVKMYTGMVDVEFVDGDCVLYVFDQQVEVSKP